MPSLNDYVQMPDGKWALKDKIKDAQKPFKGSAELLDEIARFLSRFVMLSRSQLYAITLWIIHTYLFEFADTTPYLSIGSVEKQSGKTRLLEVLELLVASPWFTGRVTAAVLARKVEAQCPTLLLDESDAAFQGEKEYSEALRGMLNTGYRRGGKCSLCVGHGASISYKDFSTFCPKAIAGIGKLPDTVADRSIPVVLKRRAPNEVVERFRRRSIVPEAFALTQEITKWKGTISMSDIEPKIPEQLNDRAADCWEPLFIIADMVGGGWLEKARLAAIELMTGEDHKDESKGVVLLNDIRVIFSGDVYQMFSTNLVSTLVQNEELSWEGLTSRKLASLLKPYGIHPTTIRIDDTTLKGYRKADFEDAWNRYLPKNGSTSVTSVTSASGELNYEAGGHPSQMPENGQKTSNVTDDIQARASYNVTDVTDRLTENNKTEQIAVKQKPLFRVDL